MLLEELARNELYRFDGRGYVAVIANMGAPLGWAGVTYWDAGNRAELTRTTFLEVLEHYLKYEGLKTR